jgi:hypothetical protein
MMLILKWSAMVLVELSWLVSTSTDKKFKTKKNIQIKTNKWIKNEIMNLYYKMLPLKRSEMVLVELS